MTYRNPDADLGLSDSEYVVWRSTLDDRWVCYVVADERAPYGGRLKVRELVTAELALDEPVNIAYAARFGPDVSDLVEWQRRCEEAVDNRHLDAAEAVWGSPSPDPWLRDEGGDG